MDFCEFAHLFYLGRGKTVLKDVSDQAGITEFLLGTVPGLNGKMTYSSDMYRMIFTGKRHVSSIGWKEIEEALKSDDKKAAERLDDEININYRETLITRIKNLGIKADKVCDADKLSDILVRGLELIAEGRGNVPDDAIKDLG